MAQIKVTVTDNEGKVIGKHDYDLANGLNGLNTLTEPERAIEQLRPQMLSDLNEVLLAEEQRVFEKNGTCAARHLKSQNQNDKREFYFGKMSFDKYMLFVLQNKS